MNIRGSVTMRNRSRKSAKAGCIGSSAVRKSRMHGAAAGAAHRGAENDPARKDIFGGE